MSDMIGRRAFLSRTIVASGAAVGFGYSFEEKTLLAHQALDGATDAKEKPVNGMPKGKIAIEPKVENAWQPIGYSAVGGLFGERLALWRNKRLWYMADDGYLLSGFESRPGVHPWQGEHVGKWLHAATLAQVRQLNFFLQFSKKNIIDANQSEAILGTISS